MKNIISFFTVFMIFFTFTANAGVTPENDPNDPIVITQPRFKGGDQKMADYVSEHLIYPTSTQTYAQEGEVTVSFCILPDGKICNARIVRGFDEACDAAALKMVKEMPNWIPATKNGKQVSSRFELKVNFELL